MRESESGHPSIIEVVRISCSPLELAAGSTRMELTSEAD